MLRQNSYKDSSCSMGNMQPMSNNCSLNCDAASSMTMADMTYSLQSSDTNMSAMGLCNLGTLLSHTIAMIGDTGLDNLNTCTSLTKTHFGDMDGDNPGSYTSPIKIQLGDTDRGNPGSHTSPTMTQLGDMGRDNLGSYSLPTMTPLGDIGGDKPGSYTSPIMTDLGGMGRDNLVSYTSPITNQLGNMDRDSPGFYTSPYMTQLGDLGTDNPGSNTSLSVTQLGDMGIANSASCASTSRAKLDCMNPQTQSMDSMALPPSMGYIQGIGGMNAPLVVRRDNGGSAATACTIDSQLAHKDKTYPCNYTDKKPPYSYVSLITMAIQNSPSKMLTENEIFQFIIERFPYYRRKEKRWERPIRWNLSINPCFVKVPRETSRSCFWTLHPESEKMFEYSRDMLRRKNPFKCEKKLANKDLIRITVTSSSSKKDSQHQSPHLKLHSCPMYPNVYA